MENIYKTNEKTFRYTKTQSFHEYFIRNRIQSFWSFFIIQGIYSVIRISEYELIAALQVKDVDYIETLVQK